MELQFYFGGSGAGKSTQLYKDIIAWAQREPDMNFLMIVPDQFTMQTQMDIVCAHPRRGIMNIDVLSFSRLAHRIFEEVGEDTRAVLDDTGKSLVLRKVAANLKDKLPAIGSNLNKQGYIHEVKSAISEFMQYGLEPAQVVQMTEYARKRGALHHKLVDLEILYEGFLEYIKGQYITTEETLDILRRALSKSASIGRSVIVFDGFTGFTPIQNRVIQELIGLTNRVIISITIDGENPYRKNEEQSLFYLSTKTVCDTCKLAEEIGARQVEAVYLQEKIAPRFTNSPELAHIQRQLFRYPVLPYEGECKRIQLYEASTPEQEARQTCIAIKELVFDKTYAYRDIAVITGDLAVYGEYMAREAKNYDIPLFLDQTKGILLNPFIEYIRSALKIVLYNFSYDTIFHFLRSGLTDFDTAEVDRLENYVLALAIKGKKKWCTMFTRKPVNSNPYEEEEQLLFLEQLNQTRAALVEVMTPLLQPMKTAGDMVKALYEFIVQGEIQQKLKRYEVMFNEENESEKAKEYSQIYRLTMELLEQVYTLLKDEEMSLQEFADILDAGFGEIEVGTIPKNIDRVVVGDMERTRLKQIRILFFVGVNDGNIPKNGGKGGIISDIDREFLAESDFELSPSPRQQMYIQRLYLYMNMTKPSEKLYLSYAKVNREGKSIRPAYLIPMLQKLFPTLTVKQPELRDTMEQLVGPQDAYDTFAVKLRAYADGISNKQEEKSLFALYQLYQGHDEYRERIRRLVDTAFQEYQAKPLSKAVARALYGSLLENSVSRLETYASCAYEHFLQYGLTLRERKEYGFEQLDIGNVFHGVLEAFAGRLEQEKVTWMDFPREQGEVWLREALNDYAVQYNETVLYSNARYEYAMERIYRILKRTVFTIGKQLQQGAFTPKQYEMSFSKVEDLEAINIALSEEEKMKLRGRIDRIDTFEDAEHVYVKVVDYKSGNKKFDLAALYYGLQLQLVVYMNVALESEKRKNPQKEVVPAAMLYYHVADPMISEAGEMTAEQINEQLLQELRMTGTVNRREEVITLLDKAFSEKSQIVPVERKKDGSFSARSSVISPEDYQTVSDFVNYKIREFGKEIVTGNITVNPYEQGNQSACTYCTYRSVCGFDRRIKGYHPRELETLDEQAAMERMREQLE